MKQRVKSAHVDDDEPYLHHREFADVYGFTKDGKMRIERGGWRDEPKTYRK